MNTKHRIITIVLFFLSATLVFPQERLIKVLPNSEKPVSAYTAGKFLQDSEVDAVLYDLHSWKAYENIHPEVNIWLNGPGEFAGDINGDGKTDILLSSTGRDIRTTDLSDNTGKTFVFYGGNTSSYDYDQLIYNRLGPVGDLNGDGYDDAVDKENFEIYKGGQSGYSTTGAVLPDFKLYYIGFNDLDGDGFDDFITYNRFDREFVLYWGDANLLSITESHTFYLGADTFTLNMADIDDDGQAELFVLVKGENIDNGITVYTFEQRELVPLQTIPYENIQGFAFQYNLSVIDINGDGFKEIMLASVESLAFTNDIDSDTTLYDPVPVLLSNNRYYPCGDLNNDGRYDFLGLGTGEASIPISYGPENLSSGLQAGNDIFINPGEALGSEFNKYGGYGDINGDGIDDVILKSSNEDEDTFGRKVVYGNNMKNYTYCDISYQNTDFHNVIRATVNVGDLNQDHIEDFCFIYPDWNSAGIFYGGETFSQTPDLMLTSDFGKEPTTAAAGDFNKDGYQDVAVNYTTGDSRIEIYLGGAQFDATPDISVRFRDLLPGIQMIYGFQTGIDGVINAGDINNDGIDDLLFSAPEATVAGEKVYKVFGILGSDVLPTEPDFVIDYSAFITPSAEFIGLSMEPLGDINNDGIDDFAVSAWANQRLFIHYGTNFEKSDNGMFSTPDLIIDPEFDYFFAFPLNVAGNGDFNGDRYNDIALLPFVMNGYTDQFIQVYYGGPDLDNKYDLLLDVPPALFGGEEDAFDEGWMLSEIAFIPDMNQDQCDELFLSSDMFFTNAAIYLGGTPPNKEPSIQLWAPNQDACLGADNNNMICNYKSAIGYFNGNNRLDFILPQIDDDNDSYESSMVYHFEADEMTSVHQNCQDFIPRDIILSSNFPNPFNPITTIQYYVGKSCHIHLTICDLLGREIAVLADDDREPGDYSVAWDSQGRPSGIYLLNLKAGNYTEVKKLVLQK